MPAIIKVSKATILCLTMSALTFLMACSSNTPVAQSTTPAVPATTTIASTTPPAPIPPSTGPALTVNIASKSGVGQYLVDSRGMSLYIFARDNYGKSTPTGATLATWPLFSPASFVLPPSLNLPDFGTITRDDGMKVATYKGWPLYNFAKDTAAGDTQGDGVAGVWFLAKVPFYTVLLQSNATLGNYLADAKGMTLYYFAKDSPGKSTTTGAVLANWPLFSPSSFVVESVLNTADFSTVTRDDGLKIATYKNWPLYYYIKDAVSGDTLGQGIGGVWSVVTPSNFSPVPAATTTSPAAPPSTPVSNTLIPAPSPTATTTPTPTPAPTKSTPAAPPPGY